MTPPKQAIKKWCNELRSGKWTQGRGHLQNGDKFCCLGVACKVFIPKGRQKLIDNELWGALPFEQPQAPKWLKEIIENFKNKTGKSLLDLNDGQPDFTFDEIADLLEAVYLLEVLK